MKTVIMAGGRGNRISAVWPDIPKPMIQIGGKPVLEHQILQLRNQGYRDFILTVSYKKENIMDYFGDGNALGVSIAYFVEEEPLGNAGALFYIKDWLTDEFLLLNGDILFDVDVQRFRNYHEKKGAVVTLFTHPNSHPYDSSLIVANKDHAVTRWYTREADRPVYYKNRVNAGIHLINKSLFTSFHFRAGEKVDLDRDILRPLVGTGTMFCYDSPEYVRDMGTPERLTTVEADVKKGVVKTKKLSEKQKAIFLDRDGTINKEVGILSDIDRFELLPGVGEAIQKINRSDYLAIVITNQPVIARGELSREGLENIHNKMETLLGKEGAYLDGIYYCPHHPHSGYEGEIRELKMDCECRKPKPGMFFTAAGEFHIDLSDSWMIGDAERDIIAGKSAGCRTVLIGKERFGQDLRADSLLDAVRKVLEGEETQNA